MKDKNGIEIQVGDVLQIRNTYFKADSGYFFVTNTENDGLDLHRTGKRGHINNGAGSVRSWPLNYFGWDAKKNAAAKTHDREHAEIEIVHNIPLWEIRDYFTAQVAQYQERAAELNHKGTDAIERFRNDAVRFTAVADRLSAALSGQEPPKSHMPEKGIRFYYNGIKVDGGPLIPCFYSLYGLQMETPTITLYAREYSGRLPREYFTVENRSDSYSDYHDKDSAEIPPYHPLYRFAHYNAMKAAARMEKEESPLLAKFRAMENPGQPTAADIGKVADMRLAEDNARREKEQAEKLERRERFLREQNDGRRAIESIAAAYPIMDGEPTVEIPFSEHPAFYHWQRDNKSLILSVPAAEIILRWLDEKQNQERETEDGHGWYYKTDFTIRYTAETGASTYEGRYDLGDNDGGLCAHIRAHGEHLDPEHGDRIVKLAAWLEHKAVAAFSAHMRQQTTPTSGKRVINVDFTTGKVLPAT